MSFTSKPAGFWFGTHRTTFLHSYKILPTRNPMAASLSHRHIKHTHTHTHTNTHTHTCIQEHTRIHTCIHTHTHTHTHAHTETHRNTHTHAPDALIFKSRLG